MFSVGQLASCFAPFLVFRRGVIRCSISGGLGVPCIVIGCCWAIGLFGNKFLLIQKKMPFGLTNAPTTFCNLMNDVLFDYLDAFAVVYLDDIVVYSQTLKEHEMHLKKVFHRLREHKMYVKPEKCEFAREQITFLGHKISEGQIRMDERKVQAVIDWPAPTKVTELRSFLGLANYYRRFIKGYSKIVSPLTDFLKKDRAWD